MDTLMPIFTTHEVFEANVMMAAKSGCRLGEPAARLLRKGFLIFYTYCIKTESGAVVCQVSSNSANNLALLNYLAICALYTQYQGRFTRGDSEYRVVVCPGTPPLRGVSRVTPPSRAKPGSCIFEILYYAPAPVVRDEQAPLYT